MLSRLSELWWLVEKATWWNIRESAFSWLLNNRGSSVRWTISSFTVHSAKELSFQASRRNWFSATLKLGFFSASIQLVGWFWTGPLIWYKVLAEHRVSLVILDRWRYTLVGYEMNCITYIRHYVAKSYASYINKSGWEVLLQIEKKLSIDDCSSIVSGGYVTTFDSKTVKSLDFSVFNIVPLTWLHEIGAGVKGYASPSAISTFLCKDKRRILPNRSQTKSVSTNFPSLFSILFFLPPPPPPPPTKELLHNKMCQLFIIQ